MSGLNYILGKDTLRKGPQVRILSHPPVKILTVTTWDAFVQAEDLTVVLYGSSTCCPCVKFKPLFEKYFEGKDIDSGYFELDQRSAKKIKTVSTVPMVVFYRNGEEITRIVGGSLLRLEGTLKKLSA